LSGIEKILGKIMEMRELNVFNDRTIIPIKGTYFPIKGIFLLFFDKLVLS
jgi:hypothetical protein